MSELCAGASTAANRADEARQGRREAAISATNHGHNFRMGKGRASSTQRVADGVLLRSRAAPPASESSGRFARLLAEAGWITGAVAAVALFAVLVTFSG
ncbi:MAG: hypothetical protein ACRECQ_00525, partial [Burkholderiaceae bacterium]